ncbi:MAG TPA: hypothetical protein VM492_09865 [Sumerlaeia bacterium]|nr:hypothetical protein [Sumerlaeia bacterium]
MSNRPLPGAKDLWRKHVGSVLRVMIGALERLRRETDPPCEEEALDRILYLRAREEYFTLPVRQRPQSFNLTQQALKSPEEDTGATEEWVRKKPDFKWRIQNDLAATPRDLTMDFDIETKRLGKPTSRSWVLNREYVEKGICRFLLPTHRYGNEVDAGAMIGYVQTMAPTEVLAEVNQYLQKAAQEGLPDFSFDPNDLVAKRILETSQSLCRRQVSPPRFTLYHLWVDLRKN